MPVAILPPSPRGLFFGGLALFFSPAIALAANGKIPNQTWVGEATLGGSWATGNTDRKAVDFEGRLKYRSGRVLDEYEVIGEFAREAGATTAERYKAGYQTNIDIEDGLFTLAFVDGEDDKFSGFRYELEGGIGVGYRVLDTASIVFSVEGGPGYRYSKLSAPLTSEKEIFARGTAKLDYHISDNAKLSNELSVSWDAERTKVEDTVSITSKIIGALSGRTSFNVRYNNNPPAATVKKTDTITKIALVYSF